MFSRNIFGPYFNGLSQVYGDPLEIYRRLNFCMGGNPSKYLEDANSEDILISEPAKEKLLESARNVFQLFPFDPLTGEGAQEEDVWKVLNDYLDWVEKKNVKEENLQNVQPSMVGGSYLPSQPTIIPSVCCG